VIVLFARFIYKGDIFGAVNIIDTSQLILLILLDVIWIIVLRTGSYRSTDVANLKITAVVHYCHLSLFSTLYVILNELTAVTD